MKILDLEVKGIKQSVGQNNSGLFSGEIVVDLVDGEVSFEIVGPRDITNYRPGIVRLHGTGNLQVNKASMRDIKQQIEAHLLTMRDLNLTPEDYTDRLDWAFSNYHNYREEDARVQVFNSHLASLTSGVR